MTEQVIYGRWEYPIGNIPSSKIFEEYRERSAEREDGISIAGLSVFVSGEDDSIYRSAIIITYDRESDTFMKLHLAGKENLKYIDVYKEQMEYNESLKKIKNI